MQHSRHNALTVELALRLAEYAQVGTVLGERVGTIDLLAGPGISRDIYDADGRSADAVIVRPDGLRIAIETPPPPRGSSRPRCAAGHRP